MFQLQTNLSTRLSAALSVVMLVCSVQLANCQNATEHAGFNLGFEKINQENYPDKWNLWGNGYKITPDSSQKFSGNYSVRIEPVGEWKKGLFGSPHIAIPAKYSGKEIELTGYLKLDNVQNGEAGLLLRIDGKNGSLQFDNMQNRNTHGTIDWKKYSIKLPLPEEAVTIYVAALHTGTGTVWADNFELKIDGKDFSSAPLKKIKEYKADLDHAFDKGSGIKIAAANKKLVEDLTVLGKVWGLLKYYHPAVARGDVNADYELFRILPSILSSKNRQERNERILSAINNLGQLSVIARAKGLKETDIKLRPDLKWIEDTNEFGEALSKKLLEVRHSKRAGDHYYIDLTPGVENPVFKNENSYASMDIPDDGFRILALYKYWNMIQYYFPYKHLIGEDWNAVLPEFIPKFVNARDQKSYTLTALELIARINDTHANIWGNKYLEQTIKGTRRLPFQTIFVEDKLMVTAYYSDTLSIKDKVKLGDIISKINGQEVEELVKQKLPFTPASNYPTQLRDLARTLLRSNENELTLEMIRAGKSTVITLPTLDNKSLNTSIDYNPNPGKTGFYVMENNIGYVFPARYKNEDLPAIKKMFSSTKGIIVDMRCYPSAFMPFTFGEYIKSNSGPFVKFTTGAIDEPGLFKFGNTLRNGGGLGENYKGKVVVIVNELSQSQAEYTTMAFQSSPNVTVIGSTTAGADGNISRFVLPGGISTMISGIGVYYPDGTETQRVGVKIDIPVKPTIKGITSGRDELLEKAVEVILSDNR